MSKTSNSEAAQPTGQMPLREVLNRFAGLAKAGKLHTLSKEDSLAQFDRMIAEAKKLKEENPSSSATPS